MPRFIKDDPDELADYIAGIGQGLVAFDGRPTAGKTPLARDIATRVGCTAVDVDKFHPGLNRAYDFAGRQKRPFVDALHIDDLGRDIDAGGPLVLMSGICAWRVIERLKMPAAAVVWVELASISRLDQMCRTFFDYDEGAGAPPHNSIHVEVQAYIDDCHARERPDVIYMNAYMDRNS